jgi:phosphate starvation-inducible PhoH-like protein
MNLHFEDVEEAKALFGPHNDYLKAIERNLDVKVHTRGGDVRLEGDELDVELAGRLLKELQGLVKRGYPIYVSDIDFAIRILSGDRSVKLEEIFLDTAYISSQKKVITPKSVVQKEYIDAIRKYDMVIGFLMKKEVQRIVLTRPAVEAGEKLGFLPGDLYEKVNPYLRPLYDALHDMLDFEQASKLVERGIIEVAPLAFMRGRTLNDSFVILDEAQNTKPEQMKMFLTRMGFGSKVVITGDITQVDLPDGKTSGLIQVQDVIKKIQGIKFVYFTEQDVIRHPLVQDIIKAYEEAELQGKSMET